MLIWQMVFAPSAPPPAVQTVPAESGTAVRPDEPATGTGEVLPEPVGEAPEQAPAEVIQAEFSEEFRLTTQSQDVRLSNEGGRVTWWRLSEYTVDGGIPVDLVPEQARDLSVLPLQVAIQGEPETTEALAKALHVHELSDIEPDDPSGIGPGKRVTFRYADGLGLSVLKTLDIPDDGYVSRMSFEVTRHGQPLPATLVWASGLAEQVARDTRNYWHVEGRAVFHDGRQVRRVEPGEVAEPETMRVRWGGLESTYFASLVMPEPGSGPSSGGTTISLTPKSAPAADGATTPLLIAGLPASGRGTYTLFVGPKDYGLLEAQGNDLEQVIDFSRISLVYLCTKYLFLALTWINSIAGNYGWSIIILTFIVRLVFFPLTYHSSIKMRQTGKKMAKIQPRVKSIQQKYRKMKRTMETQKKMNDEIMAIYKREGVNPMGSLGGCLPLLLQMPVFIGFYNLLSVTIEVRQAPFILWIHDLSSRDPYYISPILMGFSWLLQQSMTSASIPDPMQRRMMMLMPVMFTFFMLSMPSGLVIYWLTSNLLGMAQQYITNRRADQLETLSQGEKKSENRQAVSKERRAEDGQAV